MLKAVQLNLRLLDCTGSNPVSTSIYPVPSPGMLFRCAGVFSIFLLNIACNKPKYGYLSIIQGTTNQGVPTMTSAQRKRVEIEIVKCDAFISKEELRNANLRPQDMIDLLAFHKSHKLKLEGMIA